MAMNACEMVNRCLLAQWKGYGFDLRRDILEMWKDPFGMPGLVGNAGHSTYTIWWVERAGGIGQGDLLLLSVKEDIVPDDILRGLQVT